jgi:hypothetical protein
VFAAAIRSEQKTADGAWRAWSLARTFRADRMVTFVDPASPDSYAVAWRVRLNGANADFKGRLAASLPAGTAIVLKDGDAIYYGTTRPEQLALWTDVTRCGSESELPAERAQSEMAESVLRRLWR